MKSFIGRVFMLMGMMVLFGGNAMAEDAEFGSDEQALAADQLAAAAASPDYVIQFYNSLLCMKTQSNSTADNVQIEMGLCVERNYLWDFQPISGGYWKIKNRQTGKCIAVKGDSHTRGAKVVQLACTQHYSTLWKPVLKVRHDESHNDSDYYYLQNYESGYCLNVANNSTAIGADLVQYDCGSASHNDWFTWWPN